MNDISPVRNDQFQVPDTEFTQDVSQPEAETATIKPEHIQDGYQRMIAELGREAQRIALPSHPDADQEARIAYIADYRTELPQPKTEFETILEIGEDILARRDRVASADTSNRPKDEVLKALIDQEALGGLLFPDRPKGEVWLFSYHHGADHKPEWLLERFIEGFRTDGTTVRYIHESADQLRREERRAGEFFDSRSMTNEEVANFAGWMRWYEQFLSTQVYANVTKRAA